MGEAPCISLFLKSFSAALSFPQLQRCPTDEPFPRLAPYSGVRETNVHSRDMAMCFSPWNGQWNAINITALFLAASNRWCFEARGMEGRSSCYKGALWGIKYFLCFQKVRSLALANDKHRNLGSVRNKASTSNTHVLPDLTMWCYSGLPFTMWLSFTNSKLSLLISHIKIHLGCVPFMYSYGLSHGKT